MASSAVDCARNKDVHGYFEAIRTTSLGVVEISGLPSNVCESDTAYLLLPEVDFEDSNPVYVFSNFLLFQATTI